MRALLLDLGGTVFRSGHELLPHLAEAEPALRDVARRRGRLGPAHDEQWERMLRAEITERQYWALRCAELGEALGREWTMPEFMHALHSAVDEVVRPEAAELITDARAAGRAVGVLTNDLRAFHGDVAMTAHPVLAQVDALVDASVTGVLKPDPRAYAQGAAALGHAPADIVFVDDMPWNVRGAREAGMTAVAVDLAEPAPAFDRARAELGL